MAKPTLTYNINTGSNTLASGAGPAVAVTGAGAAHTGGIATTTITLTNTPDLSGVATDGTAVIWLNTAAGGRHLSRITAVDDVAKTVTVPDTFNIPAGTPVDYAIGGKRQDFENDTTNVDWADAESGWILQFEVDGGLYPVTVSIDTSPVGDNVDGGVTFQAAPGFTRPNLNMTTTIDMFNYGSATAGVQRIKGLKLTRSTGSGSSSLVRIFGGCPVQIVDCELDGTGVTRCIESRLAEYLSVEECDIHSSDDHGIFLEASRPTAYIYRSAIHDHTNDGVRFGGTSDNWAATAQKCLIYGNGGGGVTIGPSGSSQQCQMNVVACTIDNNGTGILATDTTPDPRFQLNIRDNSITNNATYGVDLTAQIAAGHVGMNDYNNYFGNTSGARNNLAAGPNDTAVDPNYTDTTPGSEDYEPAAGSGLIDAIPDRTA